MHPRSWPLDRTHMQMSITRDPSASNCIGRRGWVRRRRHSEFGQSVSCRINARRPSAVSATRSSMPARSSRVCVIVCSPGSVPPEGKGSSLSRNAARPGGLDSPCLRGSATSRSPAFLQRLDSVASERAVLHLSGEAPDNPGSVRDRDAIMMIQ